MQINADAAAEVRPLIFAGFPASSWAFALRVWLAMLLALYVSFWLELESPSSSALTVAVPYSREPAVPPAAAIAPGLDASPCLP